MPGVLLLDQVLSLLEATYGPLPKVRLPQVKFLQPLLPGQEARVELTPRSPGSWRFKVMRGDTLLATGDIASTEPAA